MTSQVENQAVEPVQLSLQNIATMVQIIDICSKRGGFEGQELEAVGGLRNRIVNFLESNKPEEGATPEGVVPTSVEVEDTDEA